MEKIETYSQLSFDTLISYHKQEGIEELTYLTILFTVIIGIIGFLGTASRVEKSARILMLLFYIGLHISMMFSFLGSMKIHDALHQEIKKHVLQNPNLFIDGKESPLYSVLKENMVVHDLNLMTFAGYFLLVFVIISVLSIGQNRLLHWHWFNKLISRKKTKK